MKRVLLVGLFLDNNSEIPTQALTLSKLLKENGYDVLTVSKYKNRFVRMVDTIYYLVKKRNSFDVGIVQVYSGLSLIWEIIAAFIIKLFNKKLILTIRGGAVPARIKKYPGLHFLLLKKADAITCPSSFTMKALSSHNISSVLIENVIPLNQYNFHPKQIIRPSIFWMRALSPIYNPLMAVEVVNELKINYGYTNVKLYMGGPDMGLERQVIEMINNYHLKDNIELIGFVDMQNKLRYADLCDVYICTNKIDNAPVTFIEMMALGLPIVSTNIGGIKDLVIDGETALLVDDEDYKSMAAKIDKLIKEPAVAKTLAENGRIFANNFSEEPVMKKWNSLFADL